MVLTSAGQFADADPRLQRRRLGTEKKKEWKKGDEVLTAEGAELGGRGGVTAGGAQAEVVPPVRLRRRAWLPVAAAARHPAL